MRPGGKLLILTMLLCLPLACGRAESPPPYSISNPQLDFATILPEGWECLYSYHFDTDNDGDLEWIILYRFDLSTDGSKCTGPIGAVVYRPDDNEPPNLIAHELSLQDDSYLCECRCEVAMEDVLSGLSGPELIVRDYCSEQVSRLAIFHWEPGQDTYLARGHFYGDCIQVTQNEVKVQQRLTDRAQLSLCDTYHPEENKTYYRPGSPCTVVTCDRKEMTFFHGEPESVTDSPYPEKVVLAFYSHYPDDAKAPTYFTAEKWKQLGECNTGVCGCIASRSEVTHVQVLKLEHETYSETKGTEPARSVVTAKIKCEVRNNAPEKDQGVKWHLIQKNGHWQLDHVELLEEY